MSNLIVDTDTIKLPDHWAPMAATDVFKLVDLPTTSSEFKSAEGKFTSSMQAGGVAINSIVKVSSN